MCRYMPPGHFGETDVSGRDLTPAKPLNAEDQRDQVPAVKDESGERPIPTAWRQALQNIVAAFVSGDYTLEREMPGVEPIPEMRAEHIRNYLAQYPATLVALPEEAWATSVCLWYGSHWQAMVDLWTAEEGRSDLVLDANVWEEGQGFRIEVHLVYVP